MTAVLQMRVAVVDDDPVQAETNATLVEQARFQPVPVIGPFHRPEQLVDAIRGRADAAICDHRLKHRGYANFWGSEAVAALNMNGIAALLVTQYSDQDADVSIRRWRASIPVMIPRDEFGADRIADSIEEVRQELRGDVRPSRRAYRTLLQIRDMSNESGDEVVDVLVPQWNAQRTVRLPIDLISDRLRRGLAIGSWLLARVNVDAAATVDLFFTDFEAAPDPLSEAELG